MMTAEITIEALASELYATFERKTRDGGEAFYTTDDDRARDVAWAGHGDEHMPCDWHYNAVHSALGDIADGNLTDDDDVHEWADGMVDVYNHARKVWFTECGEYDEDEANELCGPDADIIERLGVAQYVELRAIAGRVLEALTELLEGDES